MADLNSRHKPELVRDRFTQTAEAFGNAQTTAAEAEIVFLPAEKI